MRVYVATTFDGLRALRASRELPPGARGVAVTPAFRESYAAGDTEELEYAALTAAAAHSLALVTADEASGAGGVGGAGGPDGTARRAVLVCDVPSADESATPGEVVVPTGIPLRDVKAIHVDDPDVDLSDPEGWELMWFATQEFDDLLA